MFFIFSKILGFFLFPVVWLILLLALAIFLKNKTKRKRALVVAFLLILVLTNSYLVNKIVSVWDVTPTTVDTCYDVGIVLGGSTITYDARYNRDTFHENGDRLIQAVELYKKGIIKKILITGGSANLIYTKIKEANLMDSFLHTIDIPSSDILVDTMAQNTHQNAVYSKKILEQHPEYHTYLLITSSMHMRRARACFQKVGLKVTPYPTNLLGDNGKTNLEYLFMPDISNLLIWNSMIHEMVGYLVYKIKGYV
ncbi:MAG: YdcF family protein [Bacteroidales bacterium]|nr:YdcF family protein [Bacteroidales bacterium]